MIIWFRKGIARRAEHVGASCHVEGHRSLEGSPRGASSAETDQAQLRAAVSVLGAGDVLKVTQPSQMARSTRDRLNSLAAIAGCKAGFRSLSDARADTTTAHEQLMLNVLGGLVEFEHDRIRTRTGERREGQSRWT
jgi:DNA invertase Pin-like site-specific DNA recombinase